MVIALQGEDEATHIKKCIERIGDLEQVITATVGERERFLLEQGERHVANAALLQKKNKHVCSFTA